VSCLHGAEHLILKMTGTLPGFSEDDLAGLAFSWHDDVDGPAILVFESSPGGSGLVQRLLQNGDKQTLRVPVSCRNVVGVDRLDEATWP